MALITAYLSVLMPASDVFLIGVHHGHGRHKPESVPELEQKLSAEEIPTKPAEKVSLGAK